MNDYNARFWEEYYRRQNDLCDRNKYSREIKSGVHVDVYDVLKAWDVRNPALQHLVKKALQAGNRGHKDLMEDLRDIMDSGKRAIELEGGDGNAN